MNTLRDGTNQQVVEHTAKMLDVLIQHFSEEITLRELRVRFQLFKAFCEDPQRELSYGSIADATGVPASTVSRYLLYCLVDKCLNERIDPEDRRRRLISLGPTGMERMQEFLHDARSNGF